MMTLNEALKLLSERSGEIFDDGRAIIIMSPEADALAKILGVRSKADVAQKIARGFVNYNSGDRIIFGKVASDILPE